MTADERVDSHPIEIVHLAHTFFPSDVRVKRAVQTAIDTRRRVGVVVLQETDAATEERQGPLLVIRLPGKKSRKGPVTYLWEYVAFARRCRTLLAHDPRFADVRVVHVHTLPDFLVWGAGPARQRGARIILDLHEIFPEFAQIKFPGPLGLVAAAIARLIERQARRSADATITVNRPIAELLRARGIGRAERVVLVHNSPDPADFGPMRLPDTESRAARRIELLYHGTLTHLYGLDIAIRGVALASARGIPVHFTILGDGPERDQLTSLTQSVAPGLVTFEPPIPAQALRARLLQAAAGVVPTRLNAMTRYSLSNKLLEYVHLGIPVLAAQLPSYEAYLTYGSAWFWTPGDPESLAQAIARFAATPAEERRARAAQAQTDVQDISWDRERQRLLELYQQLLPGG